MGKGEIWHPAHQKPLNRSSPNLTHVITSWVSITKQNLDAIRPGVSSPHIREIYTLCSHVYYAFFGFFQSSSEEAQTYTINTSNDVVLRKEVPFGG